MALTAQNIIDDVSADIRTLLGTTGDDATLLLGWVDRVHKEMLRKSRWTFLLSAIQRFITERGQTDYWIGATGSEPTGAVDTLLNITDMGLIKSSSVFDRSNRRPLKRTSVAPVDSELQKRDSTYELRKPKVWLQDPTSPDLLQIYPHPDNKNNYAMTTFPPHLETTAGGSLAARIYFVRITYEDSLGNETNAGDNNEQYIAASNLIDVKSPNPPFTILAKGVQLVGYHVYASEIENSETKQTSSAIAFGTDWPEPTSGLIVGVSAPTANNITVLDGYVIHFRYWKERPNLTAVGDALLVPDKYRDIMVAGTNYYASKYLKGSDGAEQFWFQLFRDGMRQMIRDAQLYEGEDQFIHPDPASLGQGLASGGDPVQEIFFGLE